MRRLDRLAAVLLLAALIGVAGWMAAPRSHSSPAAGPSSTQEITASPTTATPYREGILGHPSSVTPLTARTQADRDLVALLFRGLMKSGKNGGLVGDLASFYTISDDGRTYVFTIGQAAWEDGVPVTAADVVFTIGLIQNGSRSGSLAASWYGIKVTAVDSKTVQFDLPAPDGAFLSQACLPLLPEHLLRDVSASELAGSSFSVRPVGNGPYRLLTLDSSHAVLARVLPGAQGTPSVSTMLDRIDLFFFDQQNQMVSSFKAGQLDAVGGLDNAPTISASSAVAGSRVVSDPWSRLTAIVVNQRSGHTEMRDARIRGALLGAVDRQSLVKSVYGAQGKISNGLIPTWSWYFDPASATPVNFNRAAVRDRFASLKWTETPTGWAPPKYKGVYAITLLAPDEKSDFNLNRIAKIVSADWRAVNLNVTLVAVPAEEYLAHLRSGDFGAAVVDFSLGLDPDLTPLLTSDLARAGGTNVSGYQDATLDKLLLTAHGTTDPWARKQAMLSVEKRIDASLPILPIAFRDYQMVVARRVIGPVTNPLADPSNRYWDVIDWRLASDG